MKTLITPGRLYAKLSTEFRKVCCERCTQCVLPVPFTASNGTWRLDDLPRDCAECAQHIESIVGRHQALYELLDPFSPLRPTLGFDHRPPTRH